MEKNRGVWLSFARSTSLYHPQTLCAWPNREVFPVKSHSTNIQSSALRWIIELISDFFCKIFLVANYNACLELTKTTKKYSILLVNLISIIIQSQFTWIVLLQIRTQNCKCFCINLMSIKLIAQSWEILYYNNFSKILSSIWKNNTHNYNKSLVRGHFVVIFYLQTKKSLVKSHFNNNGSGRLSVEMIAAFIRDN